MQNNKTKTAIILAAGQGKRISIFETPKPLVRLQNKSLTRYTIDMFLDAGVNNFYIVIKKGDNLIKKELFDYENIKYIEKDDNGSILDSVISIKDILDDSLMFDGFYISMCDLYFDKNPLNFLKLDNKQGLSILIHPYNKDSGAQEKVLLKDGRINYDFNTGDNENIYLEAGIYHFNVDAYKKFLNLVNNNSKTVRDVFLEYSKEDKIYPLVMKDNTWFDINEPIDLVRAELFLKNKLSKDNQKQKLPEYKKIKATTIYEYDKKIKYEVIVKKGIIDNLSEYEIIPHEYYYSPHFIIADRNIDKLYAEKIYQQFKKMGYQVKKILVDPGENTKSIEMYSYLANEMVSSGVDKKSVIISVGGGVVKDLAGFLASTVYRGINFISFPTTVLSQADAAIALKQGVNGNLGKNLFGSYYAPLKVIIDPNTLLTLDKKYIYDGLSECLKQSFTQDIDFYNFFKDYNGEIKNIDFLEQVVTKAAILKVDSTSCDYKEENFALVNQYGHEFGHAIEHLSGYELLHGEAVAIGMRVSAELAKILGISDEQILEAQKEMLKKYNLPINVPNNIKVADILHSLRFSKKFHGGKARFVLVDKIGSIWHDGDYYFITADNKDIIQAIKNSY